MKECVEKKKVDLREKVDLRFFKRQIELGFPERKNLGRKNQIFLQYRHSTWVHVLNIVSCAWWILSFITMGG